MCAMEHVALHAQPTTAPRSAAIALSLQALSEAELDATAEIVRTVIPAPGEDDKLPTRDGRVQRVMDPAALADALNARSVGVRIDFDHQTEPASRTFRGSTASEGWAKSFRATADGAIEAVLELSSWARHSIEQGRYRYLSPALWHNKDTKVVEDMSSLALVNNPNMALALNDAGGDRDPADLDEREQVIADREKAAERLMMNAAERAVDTAISGKRLAPAQKEFALNAIRTHADGIESGIEAFEKAFPAEGGEARPALNQLDQRIGPAGAPGGSQTTPAPSFVAPLGRSVDEESLTLHSQVAAHAREHNVSYREAVLQLGALQ